MKGKSKVREEELSRLLQSEPNEVIRNIVKALPDDMPSMRWRSSLNEKILAMGPVKKRISAAVIALRTFAGVGLACALGLGLFLAQSKPAPVKGSTGSEQELARALISQHRDSVETDEITGAGISGGEQDSVAGGQTSPDDDPDSDAL